MSNGVLDLMTDAEMATKVRMLTRFDLDHELVCVAGRDRIIKLSRELQQLRDAVAEFVHIISSDPEGEINWANIGPVLASYARQFDKGQDAIANLAQICRHPVAHWRINPDEPHVGASVEVCDWCGKSRSHWEGGESPWQMVDVSAMPRAGKAPAKG